MNKAVRSLEDKNNEYKKIIEKNDGRNYFDIIASREKEDPGIHDREYLTALKIGNHDTDAFMSKVTNHTHPDHADALSVFKDKYGSDRANAEADFNDKAVKLMDAKRNEKRNPSYENKLLSNYQVRTQEDQGFLNKLKDYMRNKWNAVGYKNDADYVNQFWETHPMPRLISNTVPRPYGSGMGPGF